MKNKILFLTFIFCLLIGNSTYSQEVDIDITKMRLKKIKIQVKDFVPSGKSDIKLAGNLKAVLKSDFELVDYFTPVIMQDDAEFVLRSSYSLKGSDLTIEGKLYETKKGQMILGKRFSGTTNQYRKLIHALTDSIITALTGENGIAQTRLAFVNPVKGKKQIYISDFDGKNVKQLTRDSCPNLFPDWSPDKDKIVYTSYLHKFPQTFIYNIAQGTRNKVCGYPGLNTSASFSLDGRKIALTLSKDGNPEIYTIGVNGKGLKRITKNRSVDTAPCWSPDGRNIAFVSSRSGTPQIYIVSSKGGTPKRLTFKGSYNTNPNWSPKGDLITYNSIRSGVFNIYTIDVNTGEVTQITDSSSSCESPSFADDGRHIVFSQTKGYNGALYIIDIFFRDPHKLIMTKGNFTSPNWSK